MRARLGDSSNNENSLNFADKAATSRDDAPVSARPVSIVKSCNNSEKNAAIRFVFVGELVAVVQAN